MKKTKKAIALMLAGTVMAGCFVGCDLVTKDSNKDLAQVIATVDITRSEEFAEGGMYAEYKDVIGEVEISKRDMIAYYQDVGYSYQQNYNLSYKEAFDWVCQSLVIRQLDVQYTMAYLLKEKVEDSEGNAFTVEGYKAAVAAGKENGNELAGISYFLDGDEEAKALYSTRRLFNNTLDSNEPDYINKKEDESETSKTERTLPTGVDTANSDYFDTDYRVYTAVGGNTLANCGSYEAVEGSTATSRKNAYTDFLGTLRRNNLLQDGENTNDIESLSYFKYELKSAYESALISKLTDEFEKKAEDKLSEEYMVEYYNTLYNKQAASFAADKTNFESKLDSISDSTFLLTAPEANYGYVINILLPFSTVQSAEVGKLQGDYGDPNGNSFKQRASILEKIKATDQRGAWFTGEKDHSYQGEGYTGGDAARKYLFFEDSLQADDNSKYESLKNYRGKYTYNGSVHYDEKTKKYTLSPNKIDIDGFIDEMEGYLADEGLTTSTDVEKGSARNYFVQNDYYKADGDVDYSKFIYYQGKVALDGFDANRMFVKDTQENKALSVINELSFAYNTDTAGLNTYLGYSVILGKTKFVSEFEYAAQIACQNGAGSYVVVPSDFGWHIIYCTFSFTGNGSGEIRPFIYDHSKIDEEGSFSYQFYEALKTNFVNDFNSNRQKMIANVYNECKTVYEDRYADLARLDT